MDAAILVLNAGSSSLKFAVYGVADRAHLAVRWRGIIEAIGGQARMRLLRAPEAADQGDRPVPAGDHHAAMALLLDWLEPRLAGTPLGGAGHRVVHGGVRYAAPVRVDGEVMDYLESLVAIDPLHQPHNLAGIRALGQARPDLPQVAAFDTAFHHGMPRVAQTFALPQALFDQGVRRYGFHGLSYEYIAGVLPDHLGAAADGRVVVAHLGNGASLCGMLARRGVDTTMSFTPLDGVPMGTRSGAVDPGVLLYLLRERGMPVAEVDELLHRRSGLLGLSGLSSDMRALLASDDAAARLAVEHYTYRVSQAVAALAVSLGGLDALVFTAGIGEHAAVVRAAVCRRLAWLGLALDEAANAAHGPRISRSDSAVSAWVIPTDEERVIARHVLRLIAGAAGPAQPGLA